MGGINLKRTGRKFLAVLLSAAMLVGRLEVFPVLLLFHPGFWHQ